MCILHLGHNSIQKLNSLEILNLSLDFIRLTVGKVDSHIQVISNIGSVQFSHSVVSDSSWPHGLHHARLPCPSPTPEACSNSCPSSWRYHPTISSFVIPFSSHLQSFSASESFPMSQFFTSGGQSIGVSASASVLPMNIQDWFPSGWTGLISLQPKGLSRTFSNSRVQKHLSLSLCYVWETFNHFVKAESFPSQSWGPLPLEDTQSV